MPELNPRKAETAVGREAASQRFELDQLALPEPVASAELVEPAALADKVEYFVGQLSDLARLGGVLCQTPHGLSETHSYSDLNSVPTREASSRRTGQARSQGSIPTLSVLASRERIYP